MAEAYAASASDRTNIDTMLKMYAQAKTIRSPLEADYKMAAAYCLPRDYNAWLTDGEVQTNTQSARRFAFDATGMNALPKYAAILNAIITPAGQRYHDLEASNRDLMKIRAVQTYFQDLNNLLFKKRAAPNARFVQTCGGVYTSCGLYGMGPKSVTYGTSMDGTKSFKYKHWSLRDVYILVNDDGEVTHVFRRFYANARQVKQKWPNQKYPRSVDAELKKIGGPDESKKFEFVQCLYYRDNHNADSIGRNRHRIASDYICVVDKEFMGDEAGYSSMPLLTPRVFPDTNIYGTSVAINALPSLGGANATKKTVIKQGHKALDPAYIAHDDGVLSNRIDIRPGRINYGGVNAAGQKLVQRLETGDFRVAESIIEDDRNDTKAAFLTDLFTILAERPQMTATQVVEELGQKASLLAPTMSMLQAEDLGPTIMRELDIMTEEGLRPDMPPELIEARGEYEIIYTSPMAKAMYAEDISGFMRWVEFSLNYAEATKDPTPLFRINMRDAQPDVARYMNVPSKWVNDDKEVDKQAAQHKQDQQQQQVIEQAPAIASVVNSAAKRGAGSASTAGVPN